MYTYISSRAFDETTWWTVIELWEIMNDSVYIYNKIIKYDWKTFLVKRTI